MTCSCVGTLTGHTGVVFSLAALPSGLLASGSSDKTIKIWDATALRCVATLTGHSDLVFSLAVLSSDLLASGSEDNTIKLWDMKTHSCVGTLTGHTMGVSSLVALQGGLLASGSYDKSIKLWANKSPRSSSTPSKLVSIRVVPLPLTIAARAPTTSTSSHSTVVLSRSAAPTTPAVPLEHARNDVGDSSGDPIPDPSAPGGCPETGSKGAPPPPPPHRSEWEAHVDPTSGETYYHNEAKGETTWDKPAGWRA